MTSRDTTTHTSITNDYYTSKEIHGESRRKDVKVILKQ